MSYFCIFSRLMFCVATASSSHQHHLQSSQTHLELAQSLIHEVLHSLDVLCFHLEAAPFAPEAAPCPPVVDHPAEDLPPSPPSSCFDLALIWQRHFSYVHF